MAGGSPGPLTGARAHRWTCLPRTIRGRFGWLEEVEADARREPLWRETGDGQGTTLIATEAGLAAIGIEPLVAEAVLGARRGSAAQKAEGAKAADETIAAGADETPSGTIRAGTKQAQIIALLQRPEGAAVTEIAAQTGWQAHTIRGAISGALKKKLGLPITAEKEEGRGTVYRIT